jgi:acyl carrier protein
LNSEIIEQVRIIVADVLSVPPSALTIQSSPQSLESWDSVRHLNLVLALEEKFSIQFSPEEMEQMGDVGRIVSLVELKAGGDAVR